jgi:multidrug efflux system outer membrane protein
MTPAPASTRSTKAMPFGAVCLLVLATGCAVLPEPTGDEIRAQALGQVAIPPNWSAQASAAQIDEAWLASFNDPTLTELVHEALARNPDLIMAGARVEQANAQVELAEANLKPALGLLARGGNKPVADLVPLLSGVMLRLSWEIDLWGRLRYARNAARAARDASSADYRFAQQSLAAGVARAWFVANESRMQLALADDMTAASQRLVDLSGQRLRVGAGTQSELMIAQANLSSYEDARAQVDLANRQALRALELLLGRYPGATLAARGTLTPFPAPVPAGIPMDALNRRPDMVAAERRVAAAFDRVGEAKAAMLPTLSLSAGFGRISNKVVETQENLERTISSVSATAVAPIYAGGALTGQVHLRTAEQKEAVADYARRALNALNEVEDALDAERVLAGRERILQQATDANRDITRMEESAYRIGRSDLRAVSQRQLAAWTTEIALLSVQRERLSRRVDLHLALGGNFVDPEPVAATTGESPGIPTTN